MSKLSIYELTIDDLGDTATTGFKLALQTLREKGCISIEQYEDFESNYVVIVRKPSAISAAWRKILGKDADVNKYVVARQESLRWQA